MNEQENLSYEFGPFRLDLASRLLLRDGQPEPLTPKAFETLLALVENSGQLVSKHELMKRIWPDTVVEEANLANNISLLRKILGQGADERPYIQTLPKRGYRFVADVRQVWNGSRKMMAGESVVAAYGQEDCGSRSVAVLPFKLLNGDENEQYLGLGLADAVITRLSNLSGVSVRPTSALLKYLDRELDAVAAGRELRVEAVLEGNIRRQGDRYRVTVQLVSARDEASLWAAKFDEQCADIFSLEDSIAWQVTSALSLKLTGAQRESLRRRYTENTVAYQHYQKGRYHWSRWTEPGFRKAIEHFQRSIEEDPLYALAWAGLADAYGLLYIHGVIPMKDALPIVEAATQRALLLDDQLAEAHLSQACLQCWVYRNYRKAEEGFRRSIELNPNFALAYQAYALYLTAMGRSEQALAEIGKAQEADPLSLINSTTEAFILYNARRYDEAIEKARKTLELDDGFHSAWERLGEAYAQLGMYDQAVAAFQKAVALSARSLLPLAGLGAAYAASGKTAEARQIVEELRGKGGREYALAWVYAGLGDAEQALCWLEAAYTERDSSLVYLKVDPKFSALRTDRRFHLLLERLGLTAEPASTFT